MAIMYKTSVIVQSFIFCLSLKSLHCDKHCIITKFELSWNITSGSFIELLNCKRLVLLQSFTCNTYE